MHHNTTGGSGYCLDSPSGLSDGSTWTGSERFYGEDDKRIIERLQFLTRRVEELEHKLETSLSSRGEDLSFDFSIDESSPVPKIDVKVLTGPKTPRGADEISQRSPSPKRSSSRLEGWDEATIEKNSSFIIIPSVANDKVAHLRSFQKKQQTLTLEYKSNPSPPAILASKSNNTRFCEEEVLSCDSNARHLSSSPRYMLDRNPITGLMQAPQQRYMAYDKESEDSEQPSTACDTESILSDDSLSSHSSKADLSLNFQGKNVNEEGSEAKENCETSPAKLNTRNNSGLSYGYTVGVAGVNSRRNLERDELRSTGHGDSVYVQGRLGDGIAEQVFHTQSEQSRYMFATSKSPSDRESRAVAREKDGARMRAELARKECLETKERFPGWEFQETFADRSFSGKYGVYKHNLQKYNGVDFYSPNSNSIDSHYNLQLANTRGENRVAENTHSTNEPDLGVKRDVGHADEALTAFVMVQEGGKICVKQGDRVKEFVNDKSPRDKEVMQMLEPIERDRHDYSIDEGSHRAPLLGNKRNVNRRDYTGLASNNRTGKTTATLENWEFVKGAPTPNVTPTPVTLRAVRSREFASPIPSENSEPQNHRVPRTQRNNTTPLESKNDLEISSSSLEEQLRGLIDPTDIGDLQEELSGRPRVLLADMTSPGVISPTESGFVEGSSVGSVFESEQGTPLNPKPHPSHDSPYSSFTSISSMNDKPYPHPSWSGKASNTDVYSCNSQERPGVLNSFSSESSRVFYIGTNSASSPRCENGMELQLPRFQTTSVNPRLDEFFSSANRQQLGSPSSSVTTSDFSDPFLECQCEYQCECQTGIPTKEDFREELKLISRYVLKERERSAKKAANKVMQRYYLDEEQGEMDIFGNKLQRGEHKIVPMLVKVILRLRKHFFGGIDGPGSLKALSPRDLNNNVLKSPAKESKRKISFSPSAMLHSAVGESSTSEIRDVIEKDKLDVNQLMPSGKSLLHKAAAVGDLESIHTLIQYGANVNQTDQDGFSPINSALRRSHYKCAIFLVECGADIAAYTKARMRELAEIKNLGEMYISNELNTPL